MLVVITRDVGNDTQRCRSCWRGCAQGGWDFVLFPGFLGFSLGLMSTSGSLSLSVFSSLLPLEANG